MWQHSPDHRLPPWEYSIIVDLDQYAENVMHELAAHAIGRVVDPANSLAVRLAQEYDGPYAWHLFRQNPVKCPSPGRIGTHTETHHSIRFPLTCEPDPNEIEIFVDRVEVFSRVGVEGELEPFTIFGIRIVRIRTFVEEITV